MSKDTLYLVPSTHWDREWYKSEPDFRVHLTELFAVMLHGLESGDLPCFHTDGQAVIVEDMLRMHPEWRSALTRFCQEGRFDFGPFYVLADMSLPSGESLFRNLFYGTELLRQLGGTPGIPYAPDAFGHHADIPAALSAAGFDAYFFCRGVGAEPNPPRTEFLWTDKSGRRSILALAGIIDIFREDGKWVSGAYGLAMNLPQEEEAFRQRMELFRKYLKNYTDAPVYLAMNGSDHLLPERNLASRVKRCNVSLDSLQIVVGGLRQYCEALKESIAVESLPRVSGEMEWGRFLMVLIGTASSHTELKVRNAQAQHLLEKIVEPAIAMASAEWRERLQPHVDQAWKWLLQNHTHDSMSCCSIDSVQREMRVRFDGIESSMRAVTERLLRLRCDVDALPMVPPRAGDKELPVACTHAATSPAQGGLWHFTVVHPADIDLKQYDLVAPDGTLWDCIILPQEKSCTTCGPFLAPGPDGRICNRSRVFTSMPLPDGYSTQLLRFRLHGEASTVSASAVELPLALQDGRLALRVNGRFVPDCLSLEDIADNGDEYRFLPPPDAKTRRNAPWQEGRTLVTRHLFFQEFTTTINAPKERDSQETVSLPVRLQLIGAAGDSGILIFLHVENNGCCHRLQLRIRTPFPFSQYVRQTQFQHLLLPVAPRPEEGPWREHTEPQRKNFGFLSVQEGAHSFTIHPQGLHEHTPDGESFRITLLRSVDNLGKSSASGPAILTPESLLLGDHVFRIALSWQGDAAATNAGWLLSDRLLEDGMGTLLQPTIAPPSFAESALHLDSTQLVMSAFYYDKTLKGRVVRIVNPTTQTGSGRLAGSLVPSAIHPVSYDKATPTASRQAISSDQITLSSGDIATFLLG